MPQLDIVTFFNQISWLTLAFLTLLPAFHVILVRPYSQMALMRRSLSTIFNSLEPNLKEPTAGLPDFKLADSGSKLVSSPSAPLKAFKASVLSKLK